MVNGTAAEGKLHIDVVWDGAVNAVAVRSSHPLLASRLMVGKLLQDAVSTVPLLFSVCGRAQGVAAAMAAEAALGMEADGSLHAARMRLILGEAVQEHLWRILLDWPRQAGMQPAVQPMTELCAIIARAAKPLLATGDWKTIGGKPVADSDEVWLILSRALNEFLHREIFGCDPALWLGLETQEELDAWCSNTDGLAAKILRGLAQHIRFGASSVAAMPRPDEIWLREASRAMQMDPKFSQQPNWHGSALETGVLARQQKQSLLKALTETAGNSVFVRAVARLTELARLASNSDCAAWTGALTLNANEGIAWTETARGLLMHRIVTDGAHVLHYQIVAPTEWNFHADGALVQGLRGMLAASEAAARNMTEWLVQSLDPCVAYEITVRHTEHEVMPEA